MNEGNSSGFSLLTLKLGDTFNTFRFIDVENMAIDDDCLNITAKKRPVGSHEMLFAIPPITRPPFWIILKSAIGNDCFGAAATLWQ